MAKTSEKQLTEIKATSLAAFQGTFAAVFGLGVAILHSLDSVAEMTAATDSVLQGLAFGLATGIVAIIVLPLVYFAIGWVLGLIQGWIFNVVLGTTGGLVVKVKE